MGGFGSSNFTGSNIASGSGKSGDSAPSITIPTDLPGGIATPAALATKINDRFRQLRGLLATFWRNPATSNYSMGGPGQPYQINNLADPVADLDAVNLRTLRRFGSKQQAAPAATSFNYAIVFSNSSLLTAGAPVAAYRVGTGKAGTPVQVWLDAQQAPNAAAYFNFMVQVGGAGAWVKLFANDIMLAAGSNGGFYSGFAVQYFPLNTRVYFTITTPSNAGIFSAGVVVASSSSS